MVTKPVESIDVSDLPDVLKVVEEARADAKPRLLRRGDEALAVITPISRVDEAPNHKTESRRRLRGEEATQRDLEAFWSAVGSWQGNVDVERFLKDNEESRRISIRPAVEL